MAFAQEYPCKIPNVNSVTCEKGQQAHCIPKGDKTWDVECVSVSPSSKNTIQNLGTSQVAMAQETNARYSATDRFVASSRNSFFALFCLGYSGNFDWAKMEADWRKKVQEEPNNTSNLHRLGISLLYQNKPVEAEREFRTVVDLKRPNPSRLGEEWPKALRALGVALYDQSKYAEAEDTFKEYLVLEELLHLHDGCSLYVLALAQAARRNYADAETSIRKEKSKGRASDYNILLASVLYDQGKFGEAEKTYRDILASLNSNFLSFPDKAAILSVLHEGLFSSLLKQGKYKDLDGLAAQISETKNSAWLTFRLALSQLNQGKHIDAEKSLKEAIAVEPTNLIFKETLEMIKPKR